MCECGVASRWTPMATSGSIRCVAFLIVAGVVFAPVAPPMVIAAITSGRRLIDIDRVVQVADPTMVTGSAGAPCSAAEPCWIVAQSAVDVVADDGTKLNSVAGRDLISFFARGKSVTYKKTSHLLHKPLLEVLWAIDPESFCRWIYTGLGSTPPASASSTSTSTCLSPDYVSARVARVGREATWLSQQRTLRECLDAVTGSGSAQHDSASACMSTAIVRALTLCVYGHEASGMT